MMTATHNKSNEPLVIKIQHIVKIYEEDMRFVKEWKRGKIIQQKAGLTKSYSSWRELDDFIWQLPLLGFLIYFIYFYLQAGLWQFITAHILYFYVFFLWKPISLYLENHFPVEANQSVPGKLSQAPLQFDSILDKSLVLSRISLGIPINQFDYLLFQMEEYHHPDIYRNGVVPGVGNLCHIESIASRQREHHAPFW